MARHRQTKKPNWRRYPGRAENYRGPRCALTIEEQMEIQRRFRLATVEHNRSKTAIELAKRYGVSSRTIWRDVSKTATPVGLEFLRMRLTDWARERDLRLSVDDMATLLLAVARHRDTQPATPDRAEAA